MPFADCGNPVGGGVFGGPRMVVEVVKVEWAGEIGPRPGWEGYLTALEQESKRSAI